MTAKTIAFLIGIIALFANMEPASARGRWGFGLGQAGVHVNSRGGVGFSAPTPQFSLGVGNGSVGVSATATPNGIGTNVSGPYGTSGGVSSDGHVYGGVSQPLPGGASGSGYFDENGVGADATVDPGLDVDF